MDCKQHLVINQLKYLGEKYSMLHDNLYLLLEFYITGNHQFHLIIKEHAGTEKKLDEIEGELLKLNPTLKEGKIEYYHINSWLRPGKYYLRLTGREIARFIQSLIQQMESYFIQPSKMLINGTFVPFFDIGNVVFTEKAGNVNINKIDCPYREKCAFIQYCPYIHPIYNNSARGVKILQTVLLKLGYADEMRYEVYKDDGSKGPRTRLAMKSFITEINEVEKLKLKYSEIMTISNIANKAVAVELKKRCSKNWRRRRYYHFSGSSRDITPDRIKRKDDLPGIKAELKWLSWRCHLRQLQEDLQYFLFLSPAAFRWANIETAEDLAGAREAFSATVKAFKTEALKGARFNPVKRELEYLAEATYMLPENSPITDIVDEKTKEEIKRWFTYIENRVHIPDLDVNPGRKPEIEMPRMEIISPSLGCTSLVKEGGTFDILLAIPEKKEGDKDIEASDILTNLPYYLFMHLPVDTGKPFLFDEYCPSVSIEDKYLVENAVRLDDSQYGDLKPRFFEDVPMDKKADFIDSPDEYYLQYDYFGNPIEMYSSSLKLKMLKIYERGKKSLIGMIGDRKIWKVTLRLKEDLSSGLFLLKIKKSEDLKPHPVKIFRKDKKGYVVYHLSDLHIARRYDDIPDYLDDEPVYCNPNDKFREIILEIKELDQQDKPDFMVITGDMVDHINSHRPYEALEGRYVFQPELDVDANWRLFHYMLTTCPGIDVPVFMIPGDHDHRYNPAPLRQSSMDLHISFEEADKYPFDLCQDQGNPEKVPLTWSKFECYGDTLFCDERALHYYYENICPFTDYFVTLDGFNFVFMNSGRSEKRFLKDYQIKPDEIGSYVQKINRRELPPPKAIGFSSGQLTWLKNLLSGSSDKQNVLCIHHPPITLNDELITSLLEPPYTEKDINEQRISHDSSSFLNGREEILDYLAQNKIKYLFCGHVHADCEVRCHKEGESNFWYAGNYSLENCNTQEYSTDSFITTTVSCGFLGRNNYSGYRILCFSAGEISFNQRIRI